ncbi:MAG: cysteine desulfurase [Bacillati bacterium ANGP1]|uniref:cysteine desulfurase n=1 Tax=Candidatus Segetimicrobium genomatis TaxID=2569760 RepID=A0A537JN65_9BACT|nr:MAG: cysteine desulfurase [Terrabacteria group bacterium ANGP1]
MRVYLDHAATTPVDPRVLHAMLPFFTERAGNASSVHGFGQDARAAVDQARAQVAATIGARPSEIVFTSGATESDNLAVVGVALAAEGRGRHIVTTAIEHHAVLEACHLLEQRGWTVTYVPVDEHGIVDPDDVRRSLRPDTVLVSVMAANNEIGTLQPVAEIGRFTRERNIPFHTDATQLVGAAPVGVDDLQVDLLSMSAHKRYGPKGVGALFVRTGTPVVPVQRGGSHERGRRGGTENVPGIVGLGAALRIALEVMEGEHSRLTALRDRLIREALEMPGAHLNGDPVRRLSNNVNLSFDQTDSQSLVLGLDLHGVASSSGSACTSGSMEPSHVLVALGLPQERASAAVRLTLGRGTTDSEITYAIGALRDVVARIGRAA